MSPTRPLYVFGLWPIGVDRLVARTGKVYRFVSCTAVARNASEARMLAERYGADFDVDWLDPEVVHCDTVRHFGVMPPEGSVFFNEVLAD